MIRVMIRVMARVMIRVRVRIARAVTVLSSTPPKPMEKTVSTLQQVSKK